MIVTKQRLSLLGCGAIAVALAWAALALFAAAMAHADAGPVPAAVAATSDGFALVAQYGPIWGGALLVFGSITALLRMNDAKHWLSSGRTLALLTGGVSVLGALLEWKLGGGQLAGVLVTAIMALKLVLSPSVAPAPTPPTVIVKNFGSNAPLLLLVAGSLVFAAVTPACATVRPRAAAGVGALIDCQEDNLRALATEAYELAEAAILSTIADDGKTVDRSKLKAALVGVKSDGLRCAVVAAVAALADPAKPETVERRSMAATRDDQVGMRATFVAVSGELGWATYRPVAR